MYPYKQKELEILRNHEKEYWEAKGIDVDSSFWSKSICHLTNVYKYTDT